MSLKIDLQYKSTVTLTESGALPAYFKGKVGGEF